MKKVKEKMTLYLAVAIAEGFHEGEDASEERQTEAWQFLHNSGAAYKLQGWFGRTARDLINEGIIKE